MIFIEIVKINDLSSVGTAYFYAVPTELKQFLQISSYKYAVPNGTKEFSNSFLMIPGGRLYATLPAYNSLWSAEDVYAGHFRRYTVSSICDVLRKAEFRIEYVTYFFSFLPSVVFLFRSLPTLFGKHTASAESSKKDQQIKEGAGSKIMNRLLLIELERIKQKNEFQSEAVV